MKTLLVLAQNPELAEAVRGVLNPQQYRVLHRANSEEAEPFLAHGLADGCIVDIELTDVQGVWLLEKIRRQAPNCPTIIYTDARASEWEEEAYLQGAAHVLSKPVRGRLLVNLLDRLWPSRDVSRQQTLSPAVGAEASRRSEPTPAPLSVLPPLGGGVQSLGVLRDFSAILTHSLNAEGMLNEFLTLLRDILSINRAAIFLRPPASSFGGSTGEESRRLRAACSVGLSTGLLQGGGEQAGR